MLVIVDAHCDSIADYVDGKRQLTTHCKEGHLDLPRLRQSGVRLQFFASFIEPEFKGDAAVIRGLKLVNGCRRLIQENPEYLYLLTGKQALNRVVSGQGTAALLSIEGGEALGENLFLLQVFYDLGVRALGLTWNHANALAGGVSEPGGLTQFGREVVREMNNLGMLVDLSHLSDPAFWDVLECSKHPPIASHSCSRNVRNHPRNLTDQQIKALAEVGGVIGINFFAQFLTDTGSAGIEDVVRHIDHICELVGSQYVGLGSDFDGCDSLPRGLEDITKLANLAVCLLEKGYSQQDVERIMGGNFVRIIGQVFNE